MSLLTEEQIAELAKRIQSHALGKSVAEVIHEWSSEYTARFKPDWNKAPKDANYWQIRETWHDKEGNQLAKGGFLAQRTRPEWAITSHPHLALIKKYAEVAERRVDPYVEFEFREDDNKEWKKLTDKISFYIDCQYRYIGE